MWGISFPTHFAPGSYSALGVAGQVQALGADKPAVRHRPLFSGVILPLKHELLFNQAAPPCQLFMQAGAELGHLPQRSVDPLLGPTLIVTLATDLARSPLSGRPASSNTPGWRCRGPESFTLLGFPKSLQVGSPLVQLLAKRATSTCALSPHRGLTLNPNDGTPAGLPRAGLTCTAHR